MIRRTLDSMSLASRQYFQMYIYSHFVHAMALFDHFPCQRLDDIVELIEQEDRALVVCKTYYEWVHRSYKHEVQAYTLLQEYSTFSPHSRCGIC